MGIVELVLVLTDILALLVFEGTVKDFLLDRQGIESGDSDFSKLFLLSPLLSRERTPRSVVNAASTHSKTDLRLSLEKVLLDGTLLLRPAMRDSMLVLHLRTSSWMDRNRVIVGRGFADFDDEHKSANMLHFDQIMNEIYRKGYLGLV